METTNDEFRGIGRTINVSKTIVFKNNSDDEQTVTYFSSTNEIEKKSDSVDSEIILFPEDIANKNLDLALIRLTWGVLHSQQDKLINYLESKTDSTFKDVNSLICEVVKFMGQPGYNNVGSPKLIKVKNAGGEWDKINTDSFFSPYQQQSCIIDIPKAVEGFLTDGVMEICLKPNTKLNVTLFFNEILK